MQSHILHYVHLYMRSIWFYLFIYLFIIKFVFDWEEATTENANVWSAANDDAICFWMRWNDIHIHAISIFILIFIMYTHFWFLFVNLDVVFLLFVVLAISVYCAIDMICIIDTLRCIWYLLILMIEHIFTCDGTIDNNISVFFFILCLIVWQHSATGRHLGELGTAAVPLQRYTKRGQHRANLRRSLADH